MRCHLSVDNGELLGFALFENVPKMVEIHSGKFRRLSAFWCAMLSAWSPVPIYEILVSVLL